MKDVTEVRLDQHEESIKEVRTDIKEISVSLISIEKENVSTTKDVKTIMATSHQIWVTTLSFVVINILMVIGALWLKFASKM